MQSKCPQLVAIIDRSWLLCHFQLRQNAHGEKNISIFGQPPIVDFTSECRIVNYLCKRLDGKISTWLTVSLKDVDNLCTYISREHKREHGKNPVVQYLYFSIIVIYILSRLAVLSLLKDTILKTSDQFWQEPCEIHSVNVLFFKRDNHYDIRILSASFPHQVMI